MGKQHYAWTPEMEAEARRMRAEGAGWKKIGKAIGRGHMTVQRYFKARGRDGRRRRSSPDRDAKGRGIRCWTAPHSQKDK